MISCHRSHLAIRCLQRGYTLEEVRACIVSENGDKITVDEAHPAYPRERKVGYAPPRPEPKGPGTELKALIARFGIKAKPGCSCNRRAQVMDKMGCDWCDENIDQIVSWLREEHEKQKILVPFVEPAVRMVIRRAIRNARKKGISP